MNRELIFKLTFMNAELKSQRSIAGWHGEPRKHYMQRKETRHNIFFRVELSNCIALYSIFAWHHNVITKSKLHVFLFWKSVVWSHDTCPLRLHTPSYLWLRFHITNITGCIRQRLAIQTSTKCKGGKHVLLLFISACYGGVALWDRKQRQHFAYENTSFQFTLIPIVTLRNDPLHKLWERNYLTNWRDVKTCGIQMM